MTEWKSARKKPVEIEYRGPYHTPPSDVHSNQSDDVIETIEGDFEIDQQYLEEHGGYVVIRGVEEEVYPCALDIFEETYDTEDNEIDVYTQGQIDTLVALLAETHATRTQGDILFAAYEAYGIPSEVVNEAREGWSDVDIVMENWVYSCGHQIPAPRSFTPSEWCPVCEDGRGPVKDSDLQ